MFNGLKNLSCLFFGLFAVFTTFTVVRQVYLNRQIFTNIQDLSVLKDSSFLNWAQQPNPDQSTYTQSFTLYNVHQDGNTVLSEKSNYSRNYNYNFRYENISFAQGNSGQLNYINHWWLTNLTNDGLMDEDNISMLNLGADKVYNYDFYSPQPRKLTIIYNTLVESLSTQFLNKFYTEYLYKFFFQDQPTVLKTVFEPLGFTSEEGKKIYNHEEYGWNNTKTFEKWVKLSLMDDQVAGFSRLYEEILLGCKLNQKEVSALVSDGSALHNMILALNGTIKSKLMSSREYSYECDDQFCSNSELIAAQLGFGFLTTDTLFGGLGLQISTKQFNGTLNGDIEYSTYCDNHPDLSCLSKGNMMSFFSQHYFGEFEETDLIYNNHNNFQFIQTHYELPEGVGESLVGYSEHLLKCLVGDETEFAWTLTTYNNLEISISSYQALFIGELFSRGFSKVFGPLKCSDYFKGDFAEFVGICENEDWNMKSSLKNYMEAYFFLDDKRQKLANQTAMTPIQLINFFHSQNTSLFAKQISSLIQKFQAAFDCQNGCQIQELFCSQWSRNSILTNLPTSIFPKSSVSIAQWDTDNVLSGFSPDYPSVVGHNIPFDHCEDTLSSSSQIGIFNLFNLMKLQQSSDQHSQNMMKYIAKTVVGVGFEGTVRQEKVGDLFEQRKSSLIEKKMEMSVPTGGAPWLENSIFLFRYSNNEQISQNQQQKTPQFNQINTGIYDLSEVREMNKVWGSTYGVSSYMSYKGKKQTDQGEIEVKIIHEYKSDHEVQGSNLLGFHPKLGMNEQPTVYFEWGHLPYTLGMPEAVDYEVNGGKISASKFSLGSGNDDFIGIEQLNHNYITVEPNSYLIVDKFTGLTLEMNINYTLKVFPTYMKFIRNETALIPIYESNVSYRRGNFDSILNIQTQNSDKNHELTLFSVLSSVMLLAYIVTLALYCVKSRRVKKEKDGSDTLLTMPSTEIRT